MRTSAFVRARRAFVLVAVLGLIASAVAMFSTAAQLQGREEGTAEAGILGLPLFVAERTAEAGGSTASLRPGIGVLIVLVVLPALAAAAVYLRDRSRAAATDTDAVRR